MSTPKRRWKWVTCDDGGIVIWGGALKPTCNDYGDFNQRATSASCDAMTTQQFQAQYGIRVKIGDCVKVEFSAKVIK